TKKRFPKNRENASIAVIFFQKNAPCPQKSPKNTYIFSAFEISRPYRINFHLFHPLKSDSHLNI
ncbi:MAG: hypothetical protein UDD86_07860, partial [Sodaliphilus sp.]|nr:hypothetical protein [Sodaliphilus sp.]